MRHRNKTIKLGRTSDHREAMLANMVSSLIKEKRITTTLQKAKAARSLAEKMVTFGKAGTLTARRMVISRLKLHGPGVEISGNKTSRDLWNKEGNVARILFEEIAPAMKDRNGGYTRIYKLGARKKSDGAEMAILEWVNYVLPQPVVKTDKAAKGEKPVVEAEATEAAAKPKAKRTKKAAASEEAAVETK